MNKDNTDTKLNASTIVLNKKENGFNIKKATFSTLNSREDLYFLYHKTMLFQNQSLLSVLIVCYVICFAAFIILYVYLNIINRVTADLVKNFACIETLITILIGLIKFIELRQMEYYKTLDKKQDREQIYNMIKDGVNDEKKSDELIEKLVDDYIK